MGNFAENLNLGNRFRPPLVIFSDFDHPLNGKVMISTQESRLVLFFYQRGDFVNMRKWSWLEAKFTSFLTVSGWQLHLNMMVRL